MLTELGVKVVGTTHFGAERHEKVVFYGETKIGRHEKNVFHGFPILVGPQKTFVNIYIIPKHPKTTKNQITTSLNNKSQQKTLSSQHQLVYNNDKNRKYTQKFRLIECAEWHRPGSKARRGDIYCGT